MSQYAKKLLAVMTASKVSFSWWNLTRKVDKNHKQSMAEAINADPERISASKKIADNSHHALKRLAKLKGRIDGYWKALSLPYVEDGVRLLPTGKVEEFNNNMQAFKAELREAAAELQLHREEIIDQARADLGAAFDATQYPDDLSSLFDVAWSFPSTKPPDWLPPEVYEEERKRIMAEFEHTVKLAEQAFAEELATMVEHLAEAMTASPDGKPKVFRDSAITNIEAFFARFSDLSIGSNEQLEHAVEDAKALLHGITPAALRKDFTLRESVKKSMAQISGQLQTMLVNKPKRKVIVKQPPAAAPQTPSSAEVEEPVACAS